MACIEHDEMIEAVGADADGSLIYRRLVSQRDDLELQGHARAHRDGKERQQRPKDKQHDSGGPGRA